MCLVLIVVIRCKGQPLTLGGGEAPSRGEERGLPDLSAGRHV